MAYNIKKIEETFTAMTDKKSYGGAKKGPPYTQWKPSLTEDGKSRTFNVRLMPYEDENKQPFQSVNYYDNKSLSPFRLVAPAQFNLEDPIAELVGELRKERNNKEAWAVIKGLLPKPRYFAPIFVREEAEKGVQVWEFSPTVCKEIYAILVSEDYRDEDVTSPDKGFDFQVTVSSSGKTFTQPGTGKTFPVNDVKLIARTKSTRLAKTPEEQAKLLASVPPLLDIFTKQVKRGDELKVMLETYLSAGSSQTTSEIEVSGVNHTEENDLASSELSDKSVADQFADL